MIIQNSYSLKGEDIIIENIFKVIGEKSRYCIDLGAGDGTTISNTRKFINKGWEGLLVDYNFSNTDIKTEFITAENINDIFNKYNVPINVDFMSIDIDGNDYWVWKAIKIFPRVVCIEHNSNLTNLDRRVLKYNPNYKYTGTGNFSASYLSLVELGTQKGYTLIRSIGDNNLIFVLTSELKDDMIITSESIDLMINL